MSAVVLPSAATPTTETMSSLELLDIINAARAEFGEPTLRNNKFIEKIENELEGELDGCLKSATVPAGGGTAMETYQLTLDQCTLVSMRESKGVRRNVLAKLKAKQLVIPDNYSDALRLAADEHERRQLAEAQRDEAVRTKAMIGAKREATAMAKASAATRKVNQLTHELGFNSRQATVIAVEKKLNRKFGKQDWRPLREYCSANGMRGEKVHDPRWGEATAWPAAAWQAVYGIELSELFPDAQLTPA